MVASSIAFSSFLSMLPLLALVAMAYGTFTELQEMIADLRAVTGILPPGTRSLISSPLCEALLQPRGRGFILSITLTVFSASRAARSLLYGLNVACRVEHRQRFIARRLVSLVITAEADTTISTPITSAAAASTDMTRWGDFGRVCGSLGAVIVLRRVVLTRRLVPSGAQCRRLQHSADCHAIVREMPPFVLPAWKVANSPAPTRV